jgi:hypothetical protein
VKAGLPGHGKLKKPNFTISRRPDSQMGNRANFKRKLAKVYQINFGLFCNKFAKIPRH